LSAPTTLVIKNDNSIVLELSLLTQWISILFDSSAAVQTLPDFKLWLIPERKNFLHHRQNSVSFQKLFIPPLLIKYLSQFYVGQTSSVAWRALGVETL